jgi:hypothetical protein
MRLVPEVLAQAARRHDYIFHRTDTDRRSMQWTSQRERETWRKHVVNSLIYRRGNCSNTNDVLRRTIGLGAGPYGDAFLRRIAPQALGSALLLAICGGDAVGQSTPTTAPGIGILHIIDLTLSSDLDSPYRQEKAGNAPNAEATVVIRISSHSQESNFFGNVRAAVPKFDLNKGSPAYEVWRDTKCHHERGFPKTTVLSIDGSVVEGAEKKAISAQFRQIGLRLPPDEVLPAKLIARGTDDSGAYMTTRTETKKTRLMVDLKLHIMACDLTTGALVAVPPSWRADRN